VSIIIGKEIKIIKKIAMNLVFIGILIIVLNQIMKILKKIKTRCNLAVLYE
jgi:hypothetical protein